MAAELSQQPDLGPVRQFSIFVENKVGRLNELVESLSGADVHIMALCLVDTTDSTIIRIVVENKIRAVQPLMASLVSRARQNGVTVAFGTDAGVYQHGRNAEELGLMKKQGMSDREVLASATTVAAKVIGMESQIGRLAPGYSADIIAVGGNPLADVTVLEKVDFVMVRGRVIE